MGEPAHGAPLAGYSDNRAHLTIRASAAQFDEEGVDEIERQSASSVFRSSTAL
jgi:hypothetical protein